MSKVETISSNFICESYGRKRDIFDKISYFFWMSATDGLVSNSKELDILGFGHAAAKEEVYGVFFLAEGLK